MTSERHDGASTQDDGHQHVNRRRMLGLAAAATAGTWVAPAVLSSPAQAQGTIAPPGSARLSGPFCGGQLGQTSARVWGTAPNGPPNGNAPVLAEDPNVSGQQAAYTLQFSVPGLYDIFSELTNGPGPPFGRQFHGTINVPAGTTFLPLFSFSCP